MKEDMWKDIGFQGNGARIAHLINMIPDVQRNQDQIEDLYTKEYANNHRKGLQVMPWQQLTQYREYLKGFYFHSRGDLKEALRFYTHSLYVAEVYSVDYWRLCALENIEQIITK